jgi:hypothetical protein
LFDPATLITNGDRKAGVLGEIETIFTDLPINIDDVSLKVPLLANKLQLVPRYDEYRIIPENWDDTETNESVSAADADAKMDVDFDLDFFEFETTGGDVFESAMEFADPDFIDLTEVSFQPGKAQKNTRQKVRFTESYCNIIRKKLDKEKTSIDIVKYLSKTPRWFEAYALRFVVENAKQIINKYKDEYADDPSPVIKSAVNRSVSVLFNVRPDHLFILGDSVRMSTLQDFETLMKRSKMYKRDCFDRFFGSGRDVTIKEYYPNSPKVFFDDSEIDFDEL